MYQGPCTGVTTNGLLTYSTTHHRRPGTVRVGPVVRGTYRAPPFVPSCKHQDRTSSGGRSVVVSGSGSQTEGTTRPLPVTSRVVKGSPVAGPFCISTRSLPAPGPLRNGGGGEGPWTRRPQSVSRRWMSTVLDDRKGSRPTGGHTDLPTGAPRKPVRRAGNAEGEWRHR